MSNDNFSFEKINYYLRPKKQIERKIFIDILKRLELDLEEFDFSKYRYIGMGSIYYYDFIIFHKFLNIRDMISFDSADHLNRFKFNRPYDFIKFENCTSTKFLENYNCNKNSIIWLDYDSSFLDFKNDYQIYEILIDDLNLLCDRANQNDFLIISINAFLPHKINQRKKVKENLKSYLSQGYKNKFITPKNFSEIVEDVILNLIEDFSKERNNKFQKLFSFNYQDSAPMFSIGGIFNNDTLIRETIFDNFTFLNSSITDIDVPHLTYKEKIMLDALINDDFLDNGQFNKNFLENKLDKIGLNFKEMKKLDKYFQYYKYYPQYYEGIV